MVGMELSKSEHQGNFGESFVQVLASAAGLTVAKENPDTREIDFTIGYKGILGSRRHPNIGVQVKSWSRPVETHGHWKYRMRAQHFNELVGTNFQYPRFLVLVIVPTDWRDYATHSRECAELRHAAYWVSLRDRPYSALAPDSKVPVDVPIANLLTMDTLHALMAPSDSVRMEA
jgi:hypothetical protein